MVLNTMGQQVFFAAEETDCCTRNCCGALRGFEMIISGEKNRKSGDTVMEDH